jgi:hypothetical protein
LVICDDACKVERRLSREADERQAAEDKKLQAERNWKPGPNETVACRGEVFEVMLNQAPTDINPYKCAMRFQVLHGRMVLSDHWDLFGGGYDIGPEGPKEPLVGNWLHMAQTRSGVARVKLMHCSQNAPAMQNWKCN